MPGSSPLFDLSGKTALITGGNGGLGLAYARGMAKQGASIVIWGRNEQKNRLAEARLLEVGAPRVLSQVVDVVDEQNVKSAFAAAVASSNGRIDCVVSNAGHGASYPVLSEIPTEAWRSILAVHLDGGFYVVREAAGHMRERALAGGTGGSILICGSLSSLGGAPGLAPYSAAKSGLLGLMRSAAAELAPLGIRVNLVAPGFIKTDIATAPALIARMTEMSPMKRVGETADLEGIAAYLASDSASFHTGDVITIDGGRMASLF